MIWTEDAAKRLNRVPQGFMRDNTKSKIEEYAQKVKASTITLEVAEGGIVEARKIMEEMMKGYTANAQAQKDIREKAAPPTR